MSVVSDDKDKRMKICLQVFLQTNWDIWTKARNEKSLTAMITFLFHSLTIRDLLCGGSRIRTGDPMLAKHVRQIYN